MELVDPRIRTPLLVESTPGLLWAPVEVSAGSPGQRSAADDPSQRVAGDPASATGASVTQASGSPGPAAPAVPHVEPREVAVDILHHVPLPDFQVRMSPALGLVALPAWFWLEGFDGRAIESGRTVDIPPLVGAEVPETVVPADDPRREERSFRVDVRVWPVRYEWSFGDGSTLVGHSLGRRYPEQSDIQHTYEFSSLRIPGGFPVSVDVEFAAEYRVNGGPAQGLPATRRTYGTSYRVQEIQSVLTRR